MIVCDLKAKYKGTLKPAKGVSLVLSFMGDDHYGQILSDTFLKVTFSNMEPVDFIKPKLQF